MKDIIYKPVYIKSEENLPKEEGFYFVHYKHPDERLHTQMSVVYYDETIKGLWFGKDWYDWYLKPVELPDEEEIKRGCPQRLIPRIACWIQGANWFKSQILK